ncbi:mitochondrial ribosomal protein L49 [Hemiscyllium ocellatum]|uniref:mitochondrial ribosomal protein L49 n=1 Tax=Hemiscyllium ocellatum TaxID=170820 RepID=UPI0029674F44|nr:mitochondrial ribosomal protein L49 [Hemiscyllium ocellatum]
MSMRGRLFPPRVRAMAAAAAAVVVVVGRRLLRAPGCRRLPLLQNYTNSPSSDPKYPGIIESTEEFQFVERLIPPTTVPVPPKHDRYPTPSGWCPPRDPPPDLPYMIRRSRMHNLPVYTDITHGNRKMTVIRKIEGDIWVLEKDMKKFLEQTTGKTPLTQVNEVAMSIRVKGYFDKELKSWLMEKGF